MAEFAYETRGKVLDFVEAQIKAFQYLIAGEAYRAHYCDFEEHHKWVLKERIAKASKRAEEVLQSDFTSSDFTMLYLELNQLFQRWLKRDPEEIRELEVWWNSCIFLQGWEDKHGWSWARRVRDGDEYLSISLTGEVLSRVPILQPA